MVIFSKKLLFTFLLIAPFNHTSYMMHNHVTIFAHGLGGCGGSGQRLYKNIIGGPIVGENGPEWGPSYQTCLAQDADIDIVIKQIEKHTEKNITLAGISKGAATMLNTVGKLAQQDPLLLNNVKAVILDSPFASPEAVAENVIRSKFPSIFQKIVTWGLTTSFMKAMTKIALKKMYPAYDARKITPLQSVKELWKNVDRNIVIVLIHSQKDTLIHINDSRLLYLELKKLGFNNLYFIETTQGIHGHADWGTQNTLVFHALNLIYLKHKLPLPECYHNQAQRYYKIAEKYKENGPEKNTFFRDLFKFQPSLDAIRKKIYS